MFDGLHVLRLHLAPHLLQLDGLAMVNVPDDPAPGINALEVISTAEYGVGLGTDAVIQETSNLVVEAVHEYRSHSAAKLGSNLHKEMVGDRLAIELFGPREQRASSWTL